MTVEKSLEETIKELESTNDEDVKSDPPLPDEKDSASEVDYSHNAIDVESNITEAEYHKLNEKEKAKYGI